MRESMGGNAAHEARRCGRRKFPDNARGTHSCSSDIINGSLRTLPNKCIYTKHIIHSIAAWSTTRGRVGQAVPCVVRRIFRQKVVGNQQQGDLQRPALDCQPSEHVCIDHSHLWWVAEACASLWAAMRLTKLGGVAGANFQTRSGALTPASQTSSTDHSGHFPTSVYILNTSFIALRRGLPHVGELARLCHVLFGEYFAKKWATSNKVTSTDLRLTANRLNMFV